MMFDSFRLMLQLRDGAPHATKDEVPLAAHKCVKNFPPEERQNSYILKGSSIDILLRCNPHAARPPSLPIGASRKSVNIKRTLNIK